MFYLKLLTTDRIVGLIKCSHFRPVFIGRWSEERGWHPVAKRSGKRGPAKLNHSILFEIVSYHFIHDYHPWKLKGWPMAKQGTLLCRTWWQQKKEVRSREQKGKGWELGIKDCGKWGITKGKSADGIFIAKNESMDHVGMSAQWRIW